MGSLPEALTDASGKPVLHMHAALGRAGHTLTGCVRNGVYTWLVGEVILYEITGARVARIRDPASGFELLDLVDEVRPP